MGKIRGSHSFVTERERDRDRMRRCAYGKLVLAVLNKEVPFFQLVDLRCVCHPSRRARFGVLVYCLGNETR